MDGYSVQEAASVLGVAEGRVWELLARGVLFGTPEGDSMRVFLKGQPGPMATATPRDDAPRTNGNGGSHPASGEASAFRELLTEFRNLTERYGQALLALGEARGEVAGLRSRVDLLEARLDLRLPPAIEASPVAWESAAAPTPATPVVERPARPPRAAPVRRTPRPRKAPSPRETVAGFADALARAQDPSRAELGEAPVEQAAEESEPAGAAELADRVETAEPAAPELEAATEPEPPTYSSVVVEPDWFADGDFAWLEAAELEASGRVEAPSPQVEAAVPEEPAEVVAAAQPEPEAATTPEAMRDAVATPALEPSIEEPSIEAEPEVAVEPEMAAEPMTEAEPEAVGGPEPAIPTAFEVPIAPVPETPAFEAEAPFEPWQPPEASPAAAGEPEPEPTTEPPATEAAEPQQMSGAVAVQEAEEEIMWLGAEAEPTQVVGVQVRDDPGEIGGWPTADAVGPPPVEVSRPPLAMTEDELARLALDEGWDEAEVAAIRAMITPPPARVELPGAAELHEAMAALEAVPVRPDPGRDASRQWAKPAAEEEEPAPRDDWAFPVEPAPPQVTPPRPPMDVTSTLRRSVNDPGWLRRRQGPAAAAYRRLRRLLPG